MSDTSETRDIGELEKRMFAKLKSFCVHSPEVDENGNVIDQYIHPSSRPTTDEEKHTILIEAKKDFPKCESCQVVDCYVKHQRGQMYPYLCPPQRAWLKRWLGFGDSS